MALLRKCFAEIIGTFVLVVFGCGTAVAVNCSTENLPGYLLTALAFGLVIVAMAYSIGNVSGCHINPAVSIAMLISKRMNIKEFCAYVCSQFIGGIAGGAVLFAIFSTKQGCNFGSNGLYQNNIWASLLIEIILTCVFVLAVLGATSKPEHGNVAGLVIGLSLTLVHIFGIYFTGTSVNPARSFGPAIFAGGSSFANVWVFIVAPLVGGVLAALIYMLIYKPEPKAEPEKTVAKAAAPAVKTGSNNNKNRKNRKKR